MVRLASKIHTTLLLLTFLAACSDASRDGPESDGAWPTDFAPPIANATFSLVEDHLPGAPLDNLAQSRQGFLFFNGFSGRILPPDTTALAVAAGEIVRIDREYADRPATSLEYWAEFADSPGHVGAYARDQLRGRQVWIRHEDGHLSRYAHLSQVNPELVPGDAVERGQPIGLIGASGVPPTKDQLEPAPRLHFELWSADGTQYLGEGLGPFEIHRLVSEVFAPEALPRFARETIAQVEDGERMPDPYPPDPLPETGFSLEPPAFLTHGAPFAAPVTWEGDDFQPQDFFAQLTGRLLGVIDAGNGAWLLGAVPLGYEEAQAHLLAGAADAYGQSMLGSQAVEVRPWEGDLQAIEVSESVMEAYNEGDAQNEARALAEIGVRSLGSTEPKWTTPFHAPLEGKVTRHFGQEIFHGLLRSAHPLPGVSIEAEPDAPVAASNAGRVVLAADLPVRGRTVAVDHGGGVVSVYAHLAEISVTEGDSVQRGQALGRAGDSGAAGEPQLRWEIHVAGTPTDPLGWHHKVLPEQQASATD